MELKDFVAQTLAGIAHGIRQAQEETRNLCQCRISPRHVAHLESQKKDTAYQTEYEGDSLEKVHFEIAVTTSVESNAKGSAKIIVADAAINAALQEAKCSHISFDVFVSWPRPEER